MRKMLHLLLVLTIVLSGITFAQVLADFEDASKGTVGFTDGDWGTGISSIERIADPTGTSEGVLAVNINLSEAGNDPMMLDNYEFPGNKPALISYDVWLPADCPDSLLLKVFTQDGTDNWTWKDVLVYGVDLPKEIWFPVIFDLRAAELSGSVYETKINRLGIEFDTREIPGGDINFSGQILVDNIKILGAEPTMFADFEDEARGTYGYYDNNGGAVLSSIDNVNGELVLGINATPGDMDQLAVDNVTAAGGADAMILDIFVPADAPDSVIFQFFSMDANWDWKQKDVFLQDISRDVWAPLYVSLQQFEAQGSDYSEKASQMGIQIGAWNIDEAWTGQVKIDNIAFINAEVGSKWVLADWEAELAGPYFEVGGWGSDNNGISTFERRDDPTEKSKGVLFSSWNFESTATDPKDAIQVTPIDLKWSETEDGATALTLDMWVPADFPVAEMSIELFLQDVDWTWNAVTPGEIVAGQWNTLKIDLAGNVEAYNLRSGNPQKIGLQIFGAVDWTGDIYFDNFVAEGIEKPEANLHAPNLIGTLIDMEFTTGKRALNTHLQWDDSDQPGLETWDIYMSEEPMTSLEDDGVIRIATDIPHGEGNWAHRPWSPTGEAKSYYYAIIGKMPEESTTLDAVAQVGPIEFEVTNIPAIATYDPNFSDLFSLDGMDTEFTENYKAHMMLPEGAGSDSSVGWTLESADCMFRNTFVVDDKYLYLSADVTDDDVITEEGVAESWKGDALEFFISAYDIGDLTGAWHTKGDVNAAGTGDHRLAYTAWGTYELNGYEVIESYPGIESVVYQKWGGDGYIIESRIELDSLHADYDFTVEKGMMLPLKIDCNDMDPTKGDETRTLQPSWGGVSADSTYAGNSESWLRPSCWGYLMLGQPDVAVDDDVNIARHFKLHDNYPNPFNPTTTIKFDIPARAKVQLMVYDMLGNKIKTIVNEKRSAGTYDVQWDGTNEMGVAVSSGVYFYKLSTDNHVATKKMMFIK